MNRPANIPNTVPNSKRLIFWLGLGGAGIALIAGLGWLAARATNAYGNQIAMSPRRRPVDAANLRQIGQAALIWASEHEGQLPPAGMSPVGIPDETTPATIYSVAAALARDGYVNDATFWFSRLDRATSASGARGSSVTTVLDSARENLEERFAAETTVTWDFATGLTTSLPATTPLAWTRGLRTDGTWDPDAGVYGRDGGYIVFLGGNVQFYRTLEDSPLRRWDGTTTTNILEALPTTARVVGAGPGTLHGSQGLGPP